MRFPGGGRYVGIPQKRERVKNTACDRSQANRSQRSLVSVMTDDEKAAKIEKLLAARAATAKAESADPQLAAAKARNATRLEALRLAVEASPKSGDWRKVLEVAREFGNFLSGMVVVDPFVRGDSDLAQRTLERQAKQKLERDPYKHYRTAETCGDWNA